jgi:hypothetical protein
VDRSFRMGTGSGEKIDNAAFARFLAHLDVAPSRQSIRGRFVETLCGEVEVDDDGTARFVMNEDELIGGDILKGRGKACAVLPGAHRDECPRKGNARGSDSPVGVCRPG